MIVKIVSSILLLTFFIHANLQVESKELQPYVSIFDVKQEKVIKVIPMTPEIINSTLQVLQSSPKIYSGFSLDPKNGLVLHYPFSSPIKIPNTLYRDKIKEIYLFLEQNEKPKALIFFDSIKAPIIVVLEFDIKKFIEVNQLQYY